MVEPRINDLGKNQNCGNNGKSDRDKNNESEAEVLKNIKIIE